MENLGLLFHPTRFGAVFDAANGDAACASKPRQSVMWASGARSSAAGGGHATRLCNERGVQIDLVATDAARAVSRSIQALCLRVKRKMTSRAA